MNNKKLIIITGVTGALGSAFLAKFAKQKNTVIYGISRQGLDYTKFIRPETSKFYLNTFICSLPDLGDETIKKVIDKIDIKKFNSITYIHGLGLYPFEIDAYGNYIVNNDHDNDGINDTTLDLSYRLFKTITAELKISTYDNKIKYAALIFGGIADKYKPIAHQSWWRVIAKTKNYLQLAAGNNFGAHLLNISSVICPHEIITRPYVFIKTDAEMEYWLSPDEVIEKFMKLTKNKNIFSGFHEYEIFNKKPRFDLLYYQEKNFTPRKVAELF
jgi:hypothetical protein